MSDRSIEEVMGWECRGTDIEAIGEWTVDGEYHRGDAIVDDLLAWLVERGYVWSAQKFGTGVAVTICYIETGVEWVPPAFEAATLHAALERAVRAVEAESAAPPTN